jgi:hypothetical protein
MFSTGIVACRLIAGKHRHISGYATATVKKRLCRQVYVYSNERIKQ